MSKSFFSNLFFLVFVNLLVKPFWIFGIDRTVQNTVGAEDYGLYFAAFNFTFLFHIILDFGINNYNNRHIAQNRNKIGDYLLNILLLKSLLAIIYMVVVMAVAFGLSFKGQQMKLVGLMALNQVLVSLVLYFRSNISALHLFRLDALLSVLDRLLVIGFCAVLLWSSRFKNDFNIEWYVYAQTAAYGITALVGLLLVLANSVKIRWKWDTEIAFQIFKSSYPFALLGLLMTIYNRVDAVMIEKMLGKNGPGEAGIYAAGYRILDAANMFGFLLAGILLPAFSKMLKDKVDVARLVAVSAKLIFVFSLLIAIGGFFYQSEITELLYAEANTYWAQVFGLLILSFIPISSVYVFGTLLTANGSLKQLNILAASGVFLNVILNVFLIEHYLAKGAVVATLVTQTLVAVAHIVLCLAIFKFKIDGAAIIKLSVFAMLITVATYACVCFDWNREIEITVLPLLTIASIVLLRVFKKKDFKILLSNQE